MILACRSVSRSSICQSNCTFVRNQSDFVRKLRWLQHVKEDGDICRETLVSPAAKFLLFFDSKPLLSTQGNDLQVAFQSLGDLQANLPKTESILESSILLNSHNNNDNDSAIFAINLPPKDHLRDEIQDKFNGTFVNFRKALFLLSNNKDVNILSEGLSCINWHINNKFCSNCGSPTEKTPSGSQRKCTQCKVINYPKMSPVAITVVHHGNQCLLARQPQFPEGMYSALAGFCDIGETMEMAVEREVAEEVGLEVDEISYYHSQHWSFPATSLMLGCHARLKPNTTDQISIDKQELEDARWFHREEIKEVMNLQSKDSSARIPNPGASFWLPPPIAIAHHLIKSWALRDNV
ncbi:NAD(P)H pyrophosphatase NUDT13, mitochondrial-like [Glandiceps talaboti]